MALSVYYLMVYLIEAFIWTKYVSTVFQRKRPKLFCLLILFFIYLSLFSIGKFYIIWLNASFFLLGNFIFTVFCFYASWHIAFFHAAMATVIMSLCELTTSHFFYPYPDAEPILLMLILWAIFSKTSYFIILFFLSYIFKEKQCNDKPYDTVSLLLIGIPLLSLITTLILFSTSINYRLDTRHEWLISMGSILLLFMNLLIFYIYHHNQKQNNYFIEMQLLIQKEHNASVYYQMLLEQNENQSILIHDIKKHLQTVALLGKQKEYQKIDTYIQTLIQSPALQSAIRICDNDLLNMILYQYQKQCSEKGILFYLDIRCSVIDFLEYNDLTSLFCNLLDNAMESAEKVSDGYIELNIDKRPPSPFIVIIMANSCLVSPFTDKDHRLVSHKKNPKQHGFGIISIKKIIEKYHGNLKSYYDTENGSFHTIITLSNH